MIRRLLQRLREIWNPPGRPACTCTRDSHPMECPQYRWALGMSGEPPAKMWTVRR